MLKKPCFQLLFLDKMLAYLVQSCVTRSSSWFGCHFLCFDPLLLTLIYFTFNQTMDHFKQYKLGLYQAYLFCKALVQSTKCYSLSLSNHAPFNLLETRQKRLRQRLTKT